MNILITGSGGFIGKNLKKYFSEKHNLLCPRSFELDLTNKKDLTEYFKNNKIDFVIHCASTGGVRGAQDDENTVEKNLSMVKNIFELKPEKAKVILFGSGAMYDKSRNLHKVKESEIGKIIPKDLYGKSKVIISDYIKNRQDALCLNIFGCYGFDEKPSRFPSYTIGKILKNEPIIIENNCVFDYLYMEDLNRIVEYFITNKTTSNIINVTPAKSISMEEIARIINTFTDHPVEIIKKSDGNEYTGDNTLLLENIPDFQFTEIEIGLKKLYDYIKSGV